MMIKLVRHGQSVGNALGYDNANVPDHTISLTDKGIVQSLECGQKLGRAFVKNALVYCSPYTRARQTLDNIFVGAGVEKYDVRIYEDPRIREVEHGYGSFEEQKKLFDTHGQFYYRYKGGESPADCYDRVSAFLDSLYRQSKRKKIKNALLVSHGLTIRLFVMRFFHLTVEQFYTIRNPWNAEIITIAKLPDLVNPIFISGSWGVEGVILKKPEVVTP